MGLGAEEHGALRGHLQMLLGSLQHTKLVTSVWVLSNVNRMLFLSQSDSSPETEHRMTDAKDFHITKWGARLTTQTCKGDDQALLLG